MPNHKLKILLFILCFLASNSFAQSFKTEWKNFKAPINWKVDFANNNENFLGTKKQGELVFKNEIDTNLKITYYAFLNFQIDSLFDKKLKELLLVQSCISSFNFKPFTLNGIYYLPQPCNKCLLTIIGSRIINAKNKEGKPMTNCELLATEVLKYTQTPQQN